MPLSNGVMISEKIIPCSGFIYYYFYFTLQTVVPVGTLRLFMEGLMSEDCLWVSINLSLLTTQQKVESCFSDSEVLVSGPCSGVNCLMSLHLLTPSPK